MGRPLQHRRRIKMALVAALALDVGVALVTSGVASAAPTSLPRASDSKVATAKAKAFATLKILKDGVSVKRKGKSVFNAAHEGQKLHVGDTIQTDATGEAEIDYTVSANSFTRLDFSTTFTIKHLTDNQGHRQVEGSLDTGRTWNRTSALTESESFSQDGAGATASVVGSAFMAECDTSGHCTFTSVVDGLKLTVDGEVKVLTPLEQCDSTELNPQNAILCGVPTQVTADVLAANAWILQNLFLDGQAGFPGPTFTVNIVVNNGVVTSATPVPPPADTTAVPGAPTSVNAALDAPGSTTAVVSWSAPASDGGSTITGYTVTGGGGCSTTGALTCTVSGLTPGTTYTFTVTATNAIGTGASGASNPVMPTAPPTVDATNPICVGSGSASVATACQNPNATGQSPAAGISTIDDSPGGDVTFLLNGSEPTAGVNYSFMFDSLPDDNVAGVGSLLATNTTLTNAAVTKTDQYTPDTQFTFVAVDQESKPTTSFSYHAVNQNNQTSGTPTVVNITVTDTSPEG